MHVRCDTQPYYTVRLSCKKLHRFSSVALVYQIRPRFLPSCKKRLTRALNKNCKLTKIGMPIVMGVAWAACACSFYSPLLEVL